MGECKFSDHSTGCPPTGIKSTGSFSYNGIAALSDLETQAWREVYACLESQQDEFLRERASFRSAEYVWPDDSLRWWSRVWEYPFTYWHLAEWRKGWRQPGLPHLVDFGSGVTFFSFAVARLGFAVTCVDVDPICEKDLKRARTCVPSEPGEIDFRLAASAGLPFEDGEVDCVISVSVVEHVPEIGATIAEIARILRPGGLFILTFDLDLRGDQQLGVGEYAVLADTLASYFCAALPQRTVHPQNMLTSDRGPFPTAARRSRSLRSRLLARLGLPVPSTTPWQLAVEGRVLRRLETPH
jgi:2-polyprenyl-3-methyl-5-hydroxy-6-metoxy-1,4-benzoquinol methylase